MIVLNKETRVQAGLESEFESAFTRTFQSGPIATARGFVRMSFLRPAEKGQPYVTQLVFEDEAALARWLESGDVPPASDVLSGRLVASPPTVSQFTIVSEWCYYPRA
jgi:heme-degrading monooxygenase HmoA